MTFSSIPLSDRTRPVAGTARRLLAVLGASALALMVFLAPAQAHSELIGSTPAEGEEVSEAPNAVVLEFNENIEAIGSEMVVTGPDGEEISTGEGEASGPLFTQELAEERPAGEYAVQWRVVSADGHPISGEFSFTSTADVAGAEEATDDTAGETEPTEDPAEETDPAGDAEEQDEPGEPTDDPGSPLDELNQDEGGFPWGIAFAVAAAGAVVALFVRSLRQVRNRED